MLSRQKLQTFILKDKHQLSAQDVLAEAQLSSLRQAEMMAWTDVELIYNSVTPTMQGEYACYTFDIWGFGESLIQDSEQSSSQELEALVGHRQVAKEADL